MKIARNLDAAAGKSHQQKGRSGRIAGRRRLELDRSENSRKQKDFAATSYCCCSPEMPYSVGEVVVAGETAGSPEKEAPAGDRAGTNGA